MARTFQPTTRHYDGVRFGDLRRNVEAPFTACHDALSACYYARQSFSWGGRQYGVLDKTSFDKLHGLISDLLLVAFHNAAQLLARPIEPAKYDTICDVAGNAIGSRVADAAVRIAALEAEGLTLTIKG